MEQQKDMNLFDLCKACILAIGRGIKWLIYRLGDALRLSFRKWWIVLICIILAIAASIYYTRPDNRIYEANAIATLNGVTTDVVRNEFLAIGQMAPWLGEQNMVQMLGLEPQVARSIRAVKTFDVIDCLKDSIVDFVDYKNRVTRTDTMYVHLPHNIALQFWTTQPQYVPQIEEAILNYLNTRPYLQNKYNAFCANLERNAQFHQDQIEKLDSLTSLFYFAEMPSQEILLDRKATGMIVGRREIKLFLEDIYDEMKAKEIVDERLAVCTAPVVLQSHFIIKARPVNSPIKCAIIAILLGWIVGLMVGAVVENRKNILHWLQTK